MLWVRGFRDHTISRPGFNLFKPLRRHFPATPVCRRPLAPRDERLAPGAAASATPRYAIRRGRRGRDREAPAPQLAGDFRGGVLAARPDFDLHRRTIAACPVDFPISKAFNGLQQGKFSLWSISAA